VVGAGDDAGRLGGGYGRNALIQIVSFETQILVLTAQ